MGEFSFDKVSRRAFLGASGALVVSFGALSRALAQEGELFNPKPPEPKPAEKVKLPGSLDSNRMLDQWLRIDADGHITVFTGKAELGQGTRTSLRQIAAEELEVEPGEIELITADTGLTPNEGYTAGSQTIQNSGTAIRYASAQARQMLIAVAAEKWGVPAAELRAEGGRVLRADGTALGYGELVSGELLHVEASADTVLKSPDSYHAIGKPFARVDIPAKVTGGEVYVQDMRLDGMLHARVVRPPSHTAKLVALDPAPVEAMPGVVKVIRDGDYLAVLAEGEWQAIQAMRALQAAAQWQESADLPADFVEYLESGVTEVASVTVVGDETVAGGKTISLEFTRPYQMHGSIGPSAAVALYQDGALTVWTHTQGVYPDRAAVAELVGLPNDKVRLIHTHGSGCYGHNGADDAGGDAAYLAMAMPGRPIRVQWMREQEHGWEPYGPGMKVKASATLDDSNTIVNWHYDLWSATHSTRPGPAGALIAGRLIDKHFQLGTPEVRISASGSGDRNAIPLYDIPNLRVNWHFVPAMPLRVSAMRSLGAYCNVFCIESLMDELALEAGEDPVAFRLRHLTDPRGRKVIEVAAEAFGWPGAPLPEGRGHGFAFARYKNHAAYLAIAMELEVDRDSGRIQPGRVVAAIEGGEAVAPENIQLQTQGGILQAISWSLYEQVHFDSTRITSTDWASYPILRFSAVPPSIEVHVVDMPGADYLGIAEGAQGPTGGALANAFRNATGRRIHDLPFTRERVKATLGV